MHNDTKIELNGEQIMVDSALAPLLIELNKVGLRTRHSCAGDRMDAYISFDADCFTNIQVITNKHGRRLVLRFPRSEC